MPPPAFVMNRSTPRAIARRTSPSVITPTRIPLPLTIPVTPSRFELIMKRASLSGVSWRTSGISSPRCIPSSPFWSLCPRAPPGRGGGREPERTGLFPHRGVQRHGGRPGHGGVRVPRQGDEGETQSFEEGQDPYDLLGLPRVREGDDDIPFPDHPDVAVHPL